MPVTLSDSGLYVASASDAPLYLATAGDALANSPIVKAVTLSKNPLGYWRLGDSAAPFADSSGNGNALAANGTVSVLQPGIVPGDPNSASVAVASSGTANFLGGSGYASKFGNQAGALTVCAWIFPTNLSAALSTIARFGTGTDEQYSLFITSGKLPAYNYYNGGFHQVNGTQHVVLNAPNHVAVVRAADGVTITLYLNGVGVTGTAPSTPSTATGTQIFAWLGSATLAQQYIGSAAELFIAMSALSAADILDIYNAGASALAASVATSEALL